jgi:hypothetical protein
MNGLNNRTYPLCLKRASNDALHRIIRDCRKTTGADKAGINRDKIRHVKAEFASREFRRAA